MPPVPITGSAEKFNDNVASLLARINYLRDEPGGGNRFFVNDLNGPLYILDKQAKKVTTYLDFNGREGHGGLFHKFRFENGQANGFVNFLFDPDYAHNGKFYGYASFMIDGQPVKLHLSLPRTVRNSPSSFAIERPVMRLTEPVDFLKPTFRTMEK